MTGRDAIRGATLLLRENGALATQLRERHRLAFVDDAQELSEAAVGLLRADLRRHVGGRDALRRCGVGGVAGTPDPARGNVRAGCRSARRCTNRCAAHARRHAPHVDRGRGSRARSLRAGGGMDYVGSASGGIAVIFRSVRNVEMYEEALLDRNIPVVIDGDVNLVRGPARARRARAVVERLRSVSSRVDAADAFRTLGLSDASLAILCAEPRRSRSVRSSPSTTSPRRRRAPAVGIPSATCGSGWNVVRGEQDAQLSAEAAERVRVFGAMREQWIEVMHARPFEAFARAVWREGLAREGAPDSARAARATGGPARGSSSGLSAFASEIAQRDGRRDSRIRGATRARERSFDCAA